MAFDFPNDPTVGQVFTPVVSGPSWMWDGSTWTGIEDVAPGEAPIDGQVYGRQLATWTPVIPFGGDAGTLDNHDGVWYLDRVNHTGMQAQATVTNLVTDLAAKAPIDSPVFTGNPTAPTPPPGDNDTSIATTAYTTAAIALAASASGFVPEAPNDTKVYVRKSATWVEGYDKATLDTSLALKSPLASPTFTGDPKAPTPTAGDNDTSVATTAFVTGALATAKTTANTDYVNVTGDTMTGALNTVGIANTGTITSSGDIVAGGVAFSNGYTFAGVPTAVILATTGTGTVYLRPNGSASTVGETTIASNGTLTCYGPVVAGGYVRSVNGYSCKPGSAGAFTANVHNINHTGPQQLWIDNTNFGNIAYTSDYRTKKDVEDLPGTWETVRALRPIKYTQADFNVPAQDEANAADPTKEAAPPLFIADDIERWGFIAHELQETMIPSAAYGEKDSHDTVQSPNPWTIIAALTRTVQEMQIRIEALEATP